MEVGNQHKTLNNSEFDVLQLYFNTSQFQVLEDDLNDTDSPEESEEDEDSLEGNDDSDLVIEVNTNEIETETERFNQGDLDKESKEKIDATDQESLQMWLQD